MNLHIFGHSISMSAVTGSGHPNTFANMLLSNYNCPSSNNHSVPAGSEERILYFLKKTKNIDVALIFHSSPVFFFTPSIDRDMYIVGEDNYFWTNKLWPKLKYLAKRVQDQPISDLDKVNAPRLDLFEFKRVYHDYLTYFHTRDLNANRHYGALIQIDQYVKSKNIPTIHCILKDSIPEWFKFSHGMVDSEICTLQNSDNQYYTGPSKSANSINDTGNLYIYNNLVQLIGALTKN